MFIDNRLFDAELATFLDVFGRSLVYEGRDSGNAMLVSPGPQAVVPEVKESIERARRLQEKHKFAFSLVSVARCIRPDFRPDKDARVLTDDRAPVNWLRDQETGSQR